MIKRLIIHGIFIALVTYMIILVERHTDWQSCTWSYLIGFGCGIASVFVGLSYSRRSR